MKSFGSLDEMTSFCRAHAHLATRRTPARNCDFTKSLMSANISENSSDDQEFKIPSCLQFFEKWRFCASSRNQFHEYYIYGKFKDCSPHKNDMQNCVTYKITKSESTKAALKEALDRDTVQFTSASVWEKRENPKDFWNQGSQH